MSNHSKPAFSDVNVLHFDNYIFLFQDEDNLWMTNN